jgi:hexosaminidase
VLEVIVEESDALVPQFHIDESYRLTATERGWLIEADNSIGARHALSTLAQLHALGDANKVGCIEDEPRFAWRGLLIDVARHFMSLPLLKRVIDGMSVLKLNVLHLHLTDDQGFRFECHAYPHLASDEFYTQDQLKELVRYAAMRCVRIVPELDVPGHVTSWLTAYPEWGYQKVDSTQRFGVHEACLDPTKEDVYAALGQIFAELTSVFPDQYVHIGGDEVHPAWWSEDPAVAALQRNRGLADIAAVQNYFTTRVVGLLHDMGKRVVGWDEVLHPDMPNLVVQNWRGATTRDRAGAHGLACIVSAPFYLDLHFPAEMLYAYDPEMSQEAWLTLEDAHQSSLALQHVAKGIEWTKQWRTGAVWTQEKTKVLGGEACLWSEIVDESTLETRLWSRLPAVAERLWSDPGGDVEDFYRRMQNLLNVTFTHEQRQRQQLHRFGLSAQQIELAMFLEPVKWYGRLLGQQALEARIAGSEMPQARPYRVDTRLDRLIDVISPESLKARALKRSSLEDWQDFARLLAKLDINEWPDDVQKAIGGLQEFGRAILGNGLDVETAEALYGPHGDYMLAPVHAWLSRVD